MCKVWIANLFFACVGSESPGQKSDGGHSSEEKVIKVSSPLSYWPARARLGDTSPTLIPASWSPTPDLVSYSSRSSAVCMVSRDGSVRLVGIGSCTITTTASKSGYRSATSSFTIEVISGMTRRRFNTLRVTTPLYYSSGSVPLSGPAPNLIPATWSPIPDLISYHSGNSRVCTVSEDGAVTLVDVGNCTITVIASKAGHGSAISSFTIAITRGASTRTLGMVSPLLYSSSTVPLGGPPPTVTPAIWSPAPDSVVYSSSNPFVCMVASDGSLSLLSAGRCTITMTAFKAGYSRSRSSFAIVITGGTLPGVIGVSTPLFYSSSSVPLGGTPPTVTPATWSVTPDAVTYSSGNPAVCTVASNGGITLRSVGNCAITATATKAGYTSATSSFNIAITAGTPLTIAVNTPLSYSSSSVPLGGTPPTVTPATWSVTPDAVTYSSGNPAVCTVASNGSITLRSVGNCAITATATKAGYTSATSSFAIAITAGTPLTIAVNTPLSYSSAVVLVSGTPPTVTPAVWSVTPDSVTYSSANPAVCTVASNGSLTLASAGNCVITATAVKAGYTSATSSFTVAITGSTTPFTSVWRVAAGNLQVQLHLKAGATYNFTVDWGDGTPPARSLVITMPMPLTLTLAREITPLPSREFAVPSMVVAA